MSSKRIYSRFMRLRRNLTYGSHIAAICHLRAKNGNGESRGGKTAEGCKHSGVASR